MNPSWISAIATSLAAVGTTAAFFVTFWAAKANWRQVNAAWRQLEHVAHEQRRAAERDEREQAAKVAAWLVAKEERGFAAVFLRYMNSSGLPVHNLTVAPVNQHGKRKCKAVISLVEPFDGIRTVRLGDFSRVVHDNVKELREDRIDYERRDQSEDQSPLLPPPSTDDYLGTIAQSGVLLQFRDTHGVTWLRLPNGKLTRSSLPFAREWKNREASIRENLGESLSAIDWSTVLEDSLRWQTELIDPRKHIRDWSP